MKKLTAYEILTEMMRLNNETTALLTMMRQRLSTMRQRLNAHTEDTACPDRDIRIEIGKEFLAWAINNQDKSQYVGEVMNGAWWNWLDEKYPRPKDTPCPDTAEPEDK